MPSKPQRRSFRSQVRSQLRVALFLKEQASRASCTGLMPNRRNNPAGERKNASCDFFEGDLRSNAQSYSMLLLCRWLVAASKPLDIAASKKLHPTGDLKKAVRCRCPFCEFCAYEVLRPVCAGGSALGQNKKKLLLVVVRKKFGEIVS